MAQKIARTLTSIIDVDQCQEKNSGICQQKVK